MQNTNEGKLARILALTTRILLRLFQVDRIEFLKHLLSHCAVDLLPFAYEQRGILKYKDGDSGEDFFVKCVLPNCLGDNPVIIDVGANRGAFSSLVHSVFPKASIFAFEPNPCLREILQVHVATYASIYNVAVGPSAGTMILYNSVDTQNSEHGSGYKAVLTAMHGYAEVIETEVETIKLGDFIEEKCPKGVDFLKIDTEGNELGVLQGCIDQIEMKRIRIIQFEFNEMNVISRAFLRDFFEVLQDYDIYRLDTNSLIRVFYTPRAEIFQFQNFVAVLSTDSASSIIQDHSVAGW